MLHGILNLQLALRLARFEVHLTVISANLEEI